MSAQLATLPQLVNQLREKFDGANVARCCLLIGAGCSYNSKIPLGGGLVELLQMEAFRNQHIVESTKWPLGKADDYKKLFDTHIDKNSLRDTYDQFCREGEQELQQQIDNLSSEVKKSKLPIQVQKLNQQEQDTFFDDRKKEFYQDAQYEYWFRRYSENASDRQRFVERVIDGKDTGYGYVTLASLMVDGYVRNVFTTNFDDLLHDALMLFFNERAKVYAHSDLSDFLNLRDKKPNIIKLHGDFRYQDIRNTTFEIDETRNRLSEKLASALAETPCFNLVVLGYGGADVSIVNQLLDAKLRNPHSPFRLIWTDRKPQDQLHWRVKHLLDTTANNFFLQIESFDLLMLQLHQALQLKPVQIEEKAKERQREIDSYYGKMHTQVDGARLSSEQKKDLQNFLQANQLFEKAYESEDLNEQCRLYEQALQLRANFPIALNNWGVSLAKLGRYGEAIAKYEQALSFKPDDSNALYNWGASLAKLGRYGEAIAKYEQALSFEPDHSSALYNWGVSLVKLGRYGEAIVKYEQALSFKPDDSDTLTNWGAALAELGRYGEAIVKYEQALSFKPDDSDTLTNWGAALAKLGRYGEAIAKYEQALSFEPDDSDTLTNWGASLAKLGRYGEAIAKYEQALSFEPDHSNTLFNIACTHALQADVDETLCFLNRWREIDANATIEMVKDDTDFDPIRGEMVFQEYMANWARM